MTVQSEKEEKRRDDKRQEESSVKVSVLTPLHEVPLPVLERAYASLRAQTFGFENIEWVVVLHNCSPSCEEEVHRFLERIPEIVLKIRNCPGTGVSYARNKTLVEATGKYVFFLDADDEMTPDCIRTVVSGMEEAQADAGVFEALWKTGKRTMDLWIDQAEDGTTVFRHTDPGFTKGLAISGSMLWTRCYRTELLKKNGLWFDEELPFGEDFIFNLEAACVAGRLKTFPGFCGYIYNEEGGTASPLHTKKGEEKFPKMSREIPVRYAALVRRMDETGREAGLDIGNMLWFRIFAMSNHLMHFGHESRGAFLNEAAPVIRRMQPPVMMDPKRQLLADGIYMHIMSFI